MKASGLIGVLLLLLSLPAGASIRDASEKNIDSPLRVGWFQSTYYMRKDRDYYSGLCREYLNRIAAYAKIQYEFVDGSFDTLYRQLQEGEIDLIPALFDDPLRREEVLFAQSPLGSEYLWVFARGGDNAPVNLEDFDGKTFAAISGVVAEKFLDYAAQRGLSLNYQIYPDSNGVEDAVEEGETDLGVLAGYTPGPHRQLIAKMYAGASFLAVTKRKPDLYRLINDTINRMDSQDPNFGSNLLLKYQKIDMNFTLSREEEEFVKSVPPLTIHVKNFKPYQYFHEKTGTFRGVNLNILNRVADITGLRFEYVLEPGEDKFSKNHDLIADVFENPILAQERGYNVTNPYILFVPALVTKRDSPGDNFSDIGILTNRYDFSNFEKHRSQLRFYDAPDRMFRDLYAGSLSALISTTTMIEYQKKRFGYSNLVRLPTDGVYYRVRLGVRQDLPPELFAVLNTAIASLDPVEISSIVNANINEIEPSLIAYLRTNPSVTFSALSALLLVACLWLFNLYYRRLRFNRELEIKLNTDEATGLLSKRGFEHFAEGRLRADQEERFFVVAMAILGFSHLSKLFGKHYIQNLLLDIAGFVKELPGRDILRSHYREGHFVCLVGADSVDDLRAPFQDLNGKVQGKFATSLRLGFGVYEVTDRSLAISEMEDLADVALSEIGSHAKNTISVYDQKIHDRHLEDHLLVASFEEALAKGEFYPVIQPQYTPDGMKVLGGEALVRWRRSDGTVIPPGKFVELLERNKLIEELDFFIFRRICALQRSLREKGISLLPLSVNFSQLHLLNPEFPERLRALTDDQGVPREYLAIEITETAYTGDAKLARELIRKIKGLGFKVYLDDYGSGNTSLALATELAFDTIKIDRSMALNSLENEQSRTAFLWLISFFKEFSFRIIVEGLETPEQVAFFRDCRCDGVQGYCFSKPIDLDDFVKLLSP